MGKVSELSTKFDEKKEAQAAVINENVEIRLTRERSLKKVQKSKAEVKELMGKHQLHEEAQKTIEKINDEKVRARKKEAEEEVDAKTGAKEKLDKEQEKQHDEHYVKYQSKEA